MPETRQALPSPPNRILRASEVVALTGLSRSTLWRLERQGKFPARRQISPAAVGWMQSQVEQWIADCQTVSAENCKRVTSNARRGRKPKVFQGD